MGVPRFEHTSSRALTYIILAGGLPGRQRRSAEVYFTNGKLDEGDMLQILLGSSGGRGERASEEKDYEFERPAQDDPRGPEYCVEVHPGSDRRFAGRYLQGTHTSGDR